MSDSYLKKIFELSSIAWKQYKVWSETKVECRNDRYWDKVVNDIRKLVKEHSDESTKQFFTDILNAYAGQLDLERANFFEQEKLPL